MLLCRVRRSKTVYFLEFNATDTIATLKLKLSRIIEGEREPKDLRLQVQKKDDSYTTLDDLEITDKAGIHDDSVVYMTYRTTPGGGLSCLLGNLSCSDQPVSFRRDV